MKSIEVTTKLVFFSVVFKESIDIAIAVVLINVLRRNKGRTFIKGVLLYFEKQLPVP